MTEASRLVNLADAIEKYAGVPYDSALIWAKRIMVATMESRA